MKYEFRRTFTYDGIRYDIRGHSEKEVTQKMIKKMKELESGSFKTDNTTVQEYTDMLLEVYKKPKIKASTYVIYCSRIKNNIYAYIGDKKLSKVTRRDCQMVLNASSEMSPITLRFIKEMLYYIFSNAIEDGLIKKNPAEKLEKPKGVTKKRRAMTEDEEKAFLDNMSEEYIVYALSYYCGLRPSEATNLRYDDIYEKDGIRYARVRGTKTANAVRTVPYPDVLPYVGTGYIATNSEEVLKYGTYASRWQTYKNKMSLDADVGEDLVPYCLRHTYCTNLAKRGIDVRIAQKLMGHSSIVITSDIYTHVDMSQIEDVAKILKEQP